MLAGSRRPVEAGGSGYLYNINSVYRLYISHGLRSTHITTLHHEQDLDCSATHILGTFLPPGPLSAKVKGSSGPFVSSCVSGQRNNRVCSQVCATAPMLHECLKCKYSGNLTRMNNK